MAASLIEPSIYGNSAAREVHHDRLGFSSAADLIALEPQDMRKSFGGLSDLAMRHLDSTLSKDALFVFNER